jgi:hypothetical protein
MADPWSIGGIKGKALVSDEITTPFSHIHSI